MIAASVAYRAGVVNARRLDPLGHRVHDGARGVRNVALTMAAVSDATTPIATFHHLDFSAEALRAAKGAARVAVCVPARDEQPTIGAIVAAVHACLVDGLGLVDELVVVDDSSVDATAQIASDAGARVVATHAGGAGRAVGKGHAMRTALESTTSDLVVFLDGDVENFSPHFVTGLLGPLLMRRQTMFVKGCYRRPIAGEPTGGGRVTELVARPVLSLLFPDLTGVVQPLAGEVAVRRDALGGIELEVGYGVELGMLIDLSRRHGVGAIAQVDLDVRIHRNRPLHELAPQARAVLSVALQRAGVDLL